MHSPHPLVHMQIGYRQEQQASPEHMCKYSRIANNKDKHSWTKQLC